MFRRQSAISAILAIALVVAACGSPGAPSSAPPGASAEPSTASSDPIASSPVSPSPVAPTATPTVAPTPSATATPTAAPSTGPTSTPTTATMIVRAYFLLDDRAGGEPALVPVLRTVPKSSAAASAAVSALLAGPTARERSAAPRLRTEIPDGTLIRDVRISSGTATVDLSDDFALVTQVSMPARIAQIVYTLTQFSSVDRVRFEIGGEDVALYRSEGVVLDQPTSRAAFRDVLPAIFVDRPAWGAAFASGSHVTGLANVVEAQFRIAVRDRAGHVLADEAATASCGTGCWGTFDVRLDYAVATAQWGSLRVWDISERDGTVIELREYPVYLRP